MNDNFVVAFGTYANESTDNVFIYILNNKKQFELCTSFNAGIRPSYVLLGENNLIYVVNEKNIQMHKSFGCIKTYKLFSDFKKVELVSTISSEGEDPCFLILSPDKKYLLSTNYSSGDLIVFNLDNKGIPNKIKTQIYFKGHGQNKLRQEKPHPHSISFNKKGDTIFISDLGTDFVYRYYWNPSSNNILSAPLNKYMVNNGDGPRMTKLSEDEKYVYIINELSNSISKYEYDSLKFVKKYSTVKDAFHNNAASHLEIKNNILFASNRGEGSIIIIDNDDISWVPSGGKSPRFFCFIENRIYILNEDNNSVYSYQLINSELNDICFELDIPKPTCLQFKKI